MRQFTVINGSVGRVQSVQFGEDARLRFNDKRTRRIVKTGNLAVQARKQILDVETRETDRIAALETWLERFGVRYLRRELISILLTDADEITWAEQLGIKC